MRSIAAITIALTFAAVTASASAVEEATFVGVVDYRRPEPPIVSAGSEHEGKNNDADGSKGTHYGDPADGCMKDEVSMRMRMRFQ